MKKNLLFVTDVKSKSLSILSSSSSLLLTRLLRFLDFGTAGGGITTALSSFESSVPLRSSSIFSSNSVHIVFVFGFFFVCSITDCNAFKTCLW